MKDDCVYTEFYDGVKHSFETSINKMNHTFAQATSRVLVDFQLEYEDSKIFELFTLLALLKVCIDYGYIDENIKNRFFALKEVINMDDYSEHISESQLNIIKTDISYVMKKIAKK
jgi:hypothetical protein